MNERVLVVSGDETEHARALDVLERAGFRTRAAGSLSRALEDVATWDPAAVVVTVGIESETDGLKLVKQLRGRADTARLAILLLTPLHSLERGVEGLDAGADDYVVLPIDPDELVARVSAHVRARQRTRRGARHLLMRAEIVEHIGTISATDSTSIAKRAVRAISTLEDVHLASVVVLEEPDRARVIAAAGRPTDTADTNREFDSVTSATLWERSLVGPWVQWCETTKSWTAYASLHGDGSTPTALVGLAFSKQPPRAGERIEGSDSALAAVTDIAAALRPVLLPMLIGRDGGARQRLGLDQMVVASAFHPVFQPVFDVRDADDPRIVGHEALTRFDDKVLPERRFAAAARLGRRHALEVAAVRRAIAAASALPQSTWVSVNVSTATLAEGADIEDALATADRPVVLEITEHDQIDDYDALRWRLSSMNPSPRLSVDDASSGYATLRHVLRLAPSFVKIDGTWIHEIDGDPARQALVGALSGFAVDNGVELIAEGVERVEELDVIRSLGVTLAQGYLLGMPEHA